MTRMNLSIYLLTSRWVRIARSDVPVFQFDYEAQLTDW